MGGYGGGGSGSSGDAKMVSDSIYSSLSGTAMTDPVHMVAPLISRPMFNNSPMSLTIVCPFSLFLSLLSHISCRYV